MIAQVTDLSNLRSAFSRVAASHGMAGVDGVSVKAFGRNLDLNLRLLAVEMEENRYRPLPLLRFLVAKKDGSPRELTVPSVRDRVAQAAVLNITEPIFEREFEAVSFAYRKGRSVKHAVRRIRKLRDRGYRYVAEADIDSYFNNVDHFLLLFKVRNLIPDAAVFGLIEQWVRMEIYDGEKVYVNEKGIPQGSVISPVLANLFLDEFDETMIGKGFELVRYSDDFIVLSKSCAQAEEALELTEETLSKLGLNLDVEDTHITHFAKGFKFLGVTFLGDAAFVPYDRPPRKKEILYMPPPFDLEGYRKGKRRWP